MVQDLYHSAPRTIGEAFRIYLQTLSAQQASLTKTALLRYVLPVWGAPEPMGKRLTSAEQADAMSLLNTIALEKLSEALDAQKRGFDEKKIDDQGAMLKPLQTQDLY